MVAKDESEKCNRKARNLLAQQQVEESNPGVKMAGDKRTDRVILTSFS